MGSVVFRKGLVSIGVIFYTFILYTLFEIIDVNIQIRERVLTASNSSLYLCIELAHY